MKSWGIALCAAAAGLVNTREVTMPENRCIEKDLIYAGSMSMDPRTSYEVDDYEILMGGFRPGMAVEYITYCVNKNKGDVLASL